MRFALSAVRVRAGRRPIVGETRTYPTTGPLPALESGGIRKCVRSAPLCSWQLNDLMIGEITECGRFGGVITKDSSDDEISPLTN